MKFEIRNRFTGEEIFNLETTSIKLCVVAAIKSGASLSGASLYCANLSGASLSGANLSGANLFRADLYCADLSGASLSGANLSGADLSGANLSGANLSGADLSGANLFRADLYCADLSGANLSGASLSGASLSGANLSGANLSGANLSGANLFRADLTKIKERSIIIARTQICPQEGAFVGWKKLKGGIIARLVIPHDALRVNSMSSRKCRASKVFVHEIFGATEAYDTHTGRTLYKVGCEVFPDGFNPSVQEECTNGIHFFMTREEAEAYAN